MAQPFRAPLDAIATAIPISAVQSATIVTEISGKLDRWVTTKQPSSVIVPGMRDVSILQGGSVWWSRGHAVPPSRVVAALGALLASLLDHTAAHRAPAGLLYVVARATDPRHLAPLTDLSEFYKTLARYAAVRRSIAMDALVARYAVACSGLPALSEESTISDVRRLRRAGGVPLAQIASDTGLPISLLRELEWGVLTHWNLDHARGALDLYAERAGLDADAVARVIEHEQVTVWTPVETAVARPRDVVPHTTDRRALPFALAAMITAAVFLTAPGDRSPRAERPRTMIPETSAAAPQPRATLAVAASTGSGIPATEPRVTPAVNPLPRRSRQVSTVARRKTAAPSSAVHPLVRFARNIVGDGRYRVEPFPKPK